ncbi:hypothetical protein M569_17754 [Genlisea aurea]|uniref:Uncharacterized protein n=1 Tax=Genlisea aurea TaxID=192259 RepID=S8BY32_9LAMI|nr:hypothetical protein M569_17754 [Genlisea aurea]
MAATQVDKVASRRGDATLRCNAAVKETYFFSRDFHTFENFHVKEVGGKHQRSSAKISDLLTTPGNIRPSRPFSCISGNLSNIAGSIQTLPWALLGGNPIHLRRQMHKQSTLFVQLGLAKKPHNFPPPIPGHSGKNYANRKIPGHPNHAAFDRLGMRIPLTKQAEPSTMKLASITTHDNSPLRLQHTCGKKEGKKLA